MATADNSSLLPYTLLHVDAELATADIAQNWKWIMGVGIVNLIAGICAVIAPITATGVILMIASLTLCFAGIATMTGLYYAENGMKTQSLIFGGSKIIVGLLIWFFPFASLMTITIIIASMFMLYGSHCCMIAFVNRGSPTWFWTFFSGLCAIAVSVLTMLAFPISSLYTVGILVGVNLMNVGSARIGIAFTGRAAAREIIETQPALGGVSA